MERVRSKNLYSNSFTRNELWNFRLMVLKTSALIYMFLLYLNPVKVQCYRIAHVYNYYSIRSTTILILFGQIRFWEVSYLDLPQELTGINWQSLKWCKILNRSVSVIGLYAISFESAGLKLSCYKYLWLVYSIGLKTWKELAWKQFVMTSSSSSIFWLIIVNRNCLQEFCCDLISGKLVFKLIYITILLYYTIHVSFRKTILISTIGTHEKII